MGTLLRALLLDLDGTLLDIDFHSFLVDYLNRVGRYFAGRYPPERFCAWVMESTRVVIEDRDPNRTNREVFWRDFEGRVGCPRSELEPLFEGFYRDVFPQLCGHGRPAPQSRRVVEQAMSRGLLVAVATSPVFPLAAVRERLRWAGLDDMQFALVASYEDMHYCKPHPEFFLEVAVRLGVKPEECLMVGNDPEGDMVAARVGMRTYLVVGAGAEAGTGPSAVQARPAAAAQGVDEGPAPSAWTPDHQGPLEGVLALLE